MRKVLLLALISFVPTILAAADLQPLNVKPGLWQVTTTTNVHEMGTPQTQTYKSCVTKESLSQYPFADRENNCKYQVLSSTGSHMEVTGTCMPPEGWKADFKIQLDVIDSENAQGTGQLTLVGPQGALHGDYTGKGQWIGSRCPAGTK